MSELDEMRIFVRVVELGSFAAAGAALDRTPSAISKTIARLEERLSVQMLNRTTRRQALTAEGERYVHRCREILSAIEAANVEAVAANHTLSGRVRINAGTGIGRHQLVNVLPKFLATHPKVSVEIGISDRRIDVISENVDIVLRAGTLADSSLVARKIAEGQRIVCASPNYVANHGVPSQPCDLLEHNCIRLSNFAQLSRWPFMTDRGIEPVDVTGTILTDNADVMLDLAIADQGIIRMTDTQCGQSIQQGLLVPLLQEFQLAEAVPFWALMPPGRYKVRRIRALLDFLTKTFSAAPWRHEHQ